MAAENTNQHHRGPKKPLHPDVLRSSNVRRAKRAIEAGQYRKGIQALTSDGLAPASSEILYKMRLFHLWNPWAAGVKRQPQCSKLRPDNGQFPVKPSTCLDIIKFDHPKCPLKVPSCLASVRDRLAILQHRL